MDTLTLVLCFGAAAVLALLVGRLLSVLLKIALVVLVIYFLRTHLDFKSTPLCQEKSPKEIQRLFCS